MMMMMMDDDDDDGVTTLADSYLDFGALYDVHMTWTLDFLIS